MITVRHKKRGFTLIELLVVVSIISMLSSVVLVALSGTRDKARITSGLSFQTNLYHTLGAATVLHLKFDEGSGSTATDLSINQNNGNIVGATYDCNDSFNSATSKCSLSFVSSNQIWFSKSLGLATSNFTIAHWMKIASDNTTAQMYSIGNAGSYDGYRFGVSAGKIAFMIAKDATVNNEAVCGSVLVNDGKWHHIAGVFDRSNLKFTCYMDGKFVADVTINNYTALSINDASPQIGSPPCCSDFIGKIDDLYVFSQNLSLVSIKELYEGQKGKYLVRRD